MRRIIVLIGVVLLAIGIVTIIFSLVKIPFASQESYDVPKYSNLITESFVVPVGELVRPVNLISGDLIHINFICTSGSNRDVDFILMDELDYLKRKAGEDFSTNLLLSRVTTYDQDYIIPQDGTWYFVWDNSFSWITQKGVTANITKNWNEIAYRDVTNYHTVIPSEYATASEYVGIAFILAGVVVIGWGLTSKEKTDIDQ